MPTPELKGTERYDVRRRIGEGGMGVVYEAFDRERRQLVALKTLLRFSPDSLYRFKQEFRMLADVIHPNLVRLHELVAGDGETVFFTMELVRGVTFRRYVLLQSDFDRRNPDAEATAEVPVGDALLTMKEGIPRAEAPLAAASPTTKEGTLRLEFDSRIGGADDVHGGAAAPSGPPDRRCPADLHRLLPAMRQLAEGVHALHLAGKLHRDIKPSNVLVTPEGRVVLLDFGVATQLRNAMDASPEREVVGTATYMAPEQALEGPPIAASDWYSVGVMLYEALVGRPPFTGSTLDLMTRKMTLNPPPPGLLVDGVPADLDVLCRDLLTSDPEMRPGGAEILRRLTSPSSHPNVTLPSAARGIVDGPLVGRQAHLQALRDAFVATREGRSVTVLVRGRSGLGKSALVHHFLDELVLRGEATALRGRVYERESIPYRAFDSIVDALSRSLLDLAANDEPLPLPDDVQALQLLFPVLRAVSPVAAASASITDPQEVRRRAFSALRALLSELGRRKPLVVYIDDVHWGDGDSIGLLVEAVRPPSAPPILFVLSYQDEIAPFSPFLSALRSRWPEGAELRELSVGPLGREDARSLALTLLAQTGRVALEDAEVIANESGGSPFLIEELARSASARDGKVRPQGLSGARGSVTLEAMVSARLSKLSARARQFLELVAIGGRPLEVSLIAEAAGIDDEDERDEDVVSQLQAHRFVRTGLRDGHEVVEVTHGRIAQALMAQLSLSTVRGHHGRLARTLVSRPAVDAEAIAQHWLGAGESLRGAEWVELAADRAAAMLAFDQATRLYKVAIDIRREEHPESPELGRLRMRLGEMDAYLSSEGLEGPLKQQVDELIKTQANIEDSERRRSILSKQIEGYRRRMDELRGPGVAMTDAAELQELGRRLSEATMEVAAVEERLRQARVKLQDAVADLSLDADTAR
jgi:serine/threonine protein kinase